MGRTEEDAPVGLDYGEIGSLSSPPDIAGLAVLESKAKACSFCRPFPAEFALFSAWADQATRKCVLAKRQSKIRHTEIQIKQYKNMKTRNQIESTPGIASRRGLTARTAFPLLAVIGAAGTLLAAIAFGQSAKAIRGATPYMEIENEPPPMLVVDPPLTNLLAQGIVWIQWRVENVRILPVFGKSALNLSPRVGHFHIRVDDLPWLWADASDLNTIDLAGMPPGPHKIQIDLVNADHEVFPGQSRTVSFTVTGTGSHAH